MEDYVKFTLRVSVDLRDDLAEEAKKQGRSMHNLIIWILNEYMKNKK